MSLADWRQAKALFEAALEKPTAERDRFLDEACGDETNLRQEVRLLLRAHAEAGSFLEHPADLTAIDGTEPRSVGETIGPYRVVRELGRGGMGVVYLAERDDGAYSKQVAIKLVKQGLGTEEIIRRFRAERQILAQLEHPNIARLLDGGGLDDGAPYLVVEFIEGEPIDRYCDARRLSIDARLELFRDVCAAVQFAHRNLVVHRDLKPSNILVTSDGVVKLLDFGIAKLIAPELASQAGELTRVGSRPMSPDYASPEQVRGERITTATDVYALGLLLHELLTGHRAYRLQSYTAEGLEEVICHRLPERPSLTVRREERFESSDGTIGLLSPEQIAEARGHEPEGLARKLSGDLDTIVLKALRKEPERRFPSVEQLAEDLRRHQVGLPVLARPDTLGYRCEKFVSRHRVGVAVAVGLLVLILAFGVAMTVQQRRVSQQRDRAEQNAERAERNAELMARERDKARRTQDFLAELFEVSDPGEARGNTITVRELLDRGALRIENELQSEPTVQADLMNTMGKVYRSLGLYEESRSLLEKALEKRRRSIGEESLEVAESLDELALLSWFEGDYEPAEPLYRQALDIRRRLRSHEHPEVAASLNNLAQLLHTRGRFDEAEALFREALRLRRTHLEDEPLELIATLNNLARLLQDRGEVETAENLFREALTLFRKAHIDDHPDKATLLDNLARLLQEKGDLEAAEPLAREALELRRRTLGQRHHYVAISLGNLARILQDQGDLVAAEPLHREALTILRELFGDQHLEVANSLGSLAYVVWSRGDLDAAESLLRQTLAIRRQLLGDEHPYVSTSNSDLGLLLLDRKKLPEAEGLLHEALAGFQKSLGPEHMMVAIVETNLGRLHRVRGELDVAEENAHRALRIFEQILPPDHWRIAVARALLGSSLAGQGRFAEAEPLLLESHPQIRNAKGAGSFYTRNVIEDLVDLYRQWGRLAKAEEYRALLP